MSRYPIFIDIMPVFHAGDPCPEGYLERCEWARVQMKAGLRQKQCRRCELWFFPQEMATHTCEPMKREAREAMR